MLGCWRVRSSANRAQSFDTSVGHDGWAHDKNSLRASVSLPWSLASWPLPWASRHSSFERSPAKATAGTNVARIAITKRLFMGLLVEQLLEAGGFEDFFRPVEVVRRVAVGLRGLGHRRWRC